MSLKEKVDAAFDKTEIDEKIEEKTGVDIQEAAGKVADGIDNLKDKAAGVFKKDKAE